MIGHHQDSTRDFAYKTTLASMLSKDEQKQFAESGPFLFTFLAGYRADCDPRPKETKGKRKLDGEKEVSKAKRQRM